MTEICRALSEIGIPFDVEGNRIRCFPHVVNITVKTGLKDLCELPSYAPDIVEDNNCNVIPQSLRDNIEYWRALECDPVAEARALVTACRASGQRREAFKDIIKAGNEAGGFGDPAGPLREVGLLKDVETRWSATFLMIDRLLEQYLAVDQFLDDPAQDEISWHRLSPITLKVLHDIRRLLQIPHIVQEIVSAEKTPTLSSVLPMYEKLIIMLKDLSRELDELSIGINAIIRKLEEYLNLSRRTKAYALAMGDYVFLFKYHSSSDLVTVLNPTIKLRWLGQHWEEEDVDNAKSAIRTAVSNVH
ncbi:hypothetical protein GGX14DRAFT_380642 [Mycena pura]|uniref:Uncharacterized protein n=1 Tax=Mycena pura TaxID=153505 RepID=A0AAD6UTS1_9AGAR|nr:hypothetical protein GGX14DRAFT_380642 [Mycena pura]